MNVETVTWRGAAGWSVELPVPDGRATMVLLLGDEAVIDGTGDPLADVHERWAGHAVVGCSTAGQFAGSRLVDGGLVAAFVRLDDTPVRAVHVDLALAGGARRAGRELARLLAHGDLRSIMVLADGLAVDGSLLAEGIADVAPDADVWGALAADGARFVHTWNVVDGATAAGTVSAVGFYGDAIEVVHGRGDGWCPVGPERLVTGSLGRVVHHVDGRAALELYEDYLGDLATGLPANASLLPMSVRDLDDRTVTRSCVAVDRSNGSVTMAGGVLQGATAQLLRGSTDGLLHGAELAAEAVRLPGDADRQLAIAFSGIGRRMTLGVRADEEPELVHAVVGANASLVGCWSYGELGRGPDRSHDVHNQTMTITTLRERRVVHEETSR